MTRFRSWIGELARLAVGRPWVMAGIVFATVLVLYVTLRAGKGIYWVDSPSLCAYLFEPSFFRQSSFLGAVRHAFSVDAGGYRPLSTLVLVSGTPSFASVDGYCENQSWIWGVGAVVAGMMAFHHLLARFFLGSAAFAGLASLLFFCSLPVQTAAYQLGAIQAFVPLFICAGLYGYCRLREMEPPVWKSRWYVLYVGVCLLGPWFREFVGVVPLLVLWREIWRPDRSRLILATSIIALAHVIYPMFLPKLLAGRLLPYFPIQSIFEMGLVGVRLGQTGGLWGSLNLDVPSHLFSLFPPLLTVGGCVALFFLAGLELWRRGARIFRNGHPGEWWCGAMPVAALTAVVIAGMWARSFSVGTTGWLGIGALFVTLWLSWLLGFPPLLISLAVLSLAPMLKLYTEDVHLGYALVPFSMLFAWILNECGKRLREITVPWARALPAAALAGFAAFVALDQGMNVPAVERFHARFSDVVPRVGRAVEQLVPEGSMIVGNALHLEDVRLYSRGRFVSYWTVQSGIPHPPSRRALTTARDFLNHLRWEKPADVYFLDFDQEYRPDKKAYHSHRFVQEFFPFLTPIHEDRMEMEYIFFDPLKRRFTRPFISFVGPPDLENDFYHGPSPKPFRRRAYCVYRLYRVDPVALLEAHVGQ